MLHKVVLRSRQQGFGAILPKENVFARPASEYNKKHGAIPLAPCTVKICGTPPAALETTVLFSEPTAASDYSPAGVPGGTAEAGDSENRNDNK